MENKIESKEILFARIQIGDLGKIALDKIKEHKILQRKVEATKNIRKIMDEELSSADIEEAKNLINPDLGVEEIKEIAKIAEQANSVVIREVATNVVKVIKEYLSADSE